MLRNNKGTLPAYTAHLRIATAIQFIYEATLAHQRIHVNGIGEEFYAGARQGCPALTLGSLRNDTLILQRPQFLTRQTQQPL